MRKKIALFSIFTFFIAITGFCQSCDCDIFPIKNECKEKCGVKLLQTGSKKQIKNNFKVTEETARKIVSVPNRKNKTSVVDFQDDLPPKYYKDLDSNFAIFIGASISQNNIIAPNALIVTQNQSGGSNTVINPQVNVPLPKIRLINISSQNEVVREIPAKPPFPNKTIKLPTEQFKYDSLYKTTFTLLYICDVSLNEIGFRIKRNDVIYLKVTHPGMMMSGQSKDQTSTVYLVNHPENGNYTFEVYTEKQFGNILSEIDYLK
jgi:hypothetical protein